MSDMQGSALLDPIPEATRRLATALGRERSGEILAFVGRNPHCSASEVARAHDIHIATAQKYLRELAACGLLNLHTRDAAPRAVEEYSLATERVRIDIDLGVATGPADLAWARGTHLADGGLRTVVYEADAVGRRVREILIVADGPRARVVARYSPDPPLGRILFLLPPHEVGPVPIADLLARAGLDAAVIPAVRADLAALLETLPEGALRLIPPDGGSAPREAVA